MLSRPAFPFHHRRTWFESKSVSTELCVATDQSGLDGKTVRGPVRRQLNLSNGFRQQSGPKRCIESRDAISNVMMLNNTVPPKRLTHARRWLRQRESRRK